MLLRLWLLVLLLVLGVLAPGVVDARIQDRVWPPAASAEKLASWGGHPETAVLRQAATMQAAETQQAASSLGYETASVLSLAPENGARALPGGVQLRQVGNYYIKEVNPNASRLAQWWGRGSLDAQAKALGKLGDMAPSHLYKNGKLVMRDAGAYTPGNFWSTWAAGSKRLGTPFNDIRPRNIGAGGLIFDPAKHPIQQGLEATAVGLGVTAGGLYLYDQFSN